MAVNMVCRVTVGFFTGPRYNGIKVLNTSGVAVVVVIGVLTLELFMGEASSLKCKRRILKSLLDRMKSRFNVAVAEVDNQDKWQYSTVGVTCVTNDQSHAHQMLSAVVKYIETNGTVEILHIQTELL